MIESLIDGIDFTLSCCPEARFEELNMEHFRNSMGSVEKVSQ